MPFGRLPDMPRGLERLRDAVTLRARATTPSSTVSAPSESPPSAAMPRAKCAMLTQDWFWTLASAAASREAELKVLTRTQRASSTTGIGAQDAVAAVTLDFHPSLHPPQKLGLKPKTKVNHPVMVATWKRGSRLHRHPSRRAGKLP